MGVEGKCQEEGKSRIIVAMRGQIIVAATTFVRMGGISNVARSNTILDGRLLTQRGLVTSTARLGDSDKVDQTNLAQKVDPKDAAAKKAAEEATKKALEKKKLEDAKAIKKSEEAAAKKKAEEAAAAASKKKAEEAAVAKKKAEEAAAKKKAEEEAAAKKKAEEEAAAKKKAEEDAAAKKKAEEAAAAKKKAEEEAAAKKKAEEAAAEAEATAIANMKDPIQELFLTSIRAYTTSGGLANADVTTKTEVNAELSRVAKQFGGSEGEDMTKFPEFKFADGEVDSINVSSS